MKHRSTWKDLIGARASKPWGYATGHHNRNGHRQIGKWKCGPGGIDCPCCCKAHPSKLKVYFSRWVRRSAKQLLKTEY